MSNRVLVYVGSLSPLGPAAPVLVAAGELARAGVELHLVISQPPEGKDGLQELPGARIHNIRERRGSRTEWMELRRLTAEIQPRIAVNWCGPAWLDLAWTGPAERHAAFESRDQAVRRLRRGRRLPQRVFLPAVGTEPGDGGSGLQTVPAGRKKTVPVSHFPPALFPVDPGWTRRDLLARLELEENAFLVCAAASLEPPSNLKDLIWATDLLCCVRDDVHLLILGSGRQQAGLERFARLTDAAGHIHFSGEPADSQTLVRSADCFWQSAAHPSARLPVLAAMSAGVPVIASASRGLAGLILHQRTGLLVPPGSRDGFARWTLYLDEQPDQRQRLVDQARVPAGRILQATPSAAEILAVHWT